MTKAGAKEGSIGSKGAFDVNRSPVPVAVTGRLSDSMIKFCSCTGRASSSSLRNVNNTGISVTCKGCGESTTDMVGPSCSNKLNSMGLELPRPLDLQVRWKNVNRRQRAARRARTSFFGEDRMKDELRSFYSFGNAMNREISQDVPVSDSEKLGVSILGRRFSDPKGKVPTKKRRFHVDYSPSPPPTSLLVDRYEKILRSCSGGVPSYEKRCKVKMLEDEYKEEHSGLFGADDFSGISILAAVACESEMDDDMLSGACSKLDHSLEQRKLENTVSSTELSLLHDMKGDKSNVPEPSHCTYDKPFDSSNSAPDMKPLFASTLTSSENLDESASAPKVNCSLYSALRSADKTEIASDTKSSSVAMLSNSSNPDKSVGCPEDAAAHTKFANATRDSRLHWDLNVAMEAWDTYSCGDDDHGGPTVTTVSDHNDAENDMNNPQLLHDHDSIDAGDAPDLSVDRIHIVDVRKDVNTMNKDNFPVNSSPNHLQHQSSQNLEMLKSESVGKDTSAETLDLPDQQKSLFAPTMESHIGYLPEPALISEHFPLTANVEKNDGSHPTSVGCKGLSQMSSVDGHVGDNSIQISELVSTVKPLASRLVSEESTNLPTVTAFRKIITDVGWSDNKLEEASEQSISEWKNQELLVDSGTSKMHHLVSKKDKHDAAVLYGTKSTVDSENLTHPEDISGSSVCDMAHVHGEDGADAMINSKDCLNTCACSSSAETYYISAAVQAPAFSSECNKPVITDAGSIVDSQIAARSYQRIYENELGKVAPDICLEHCYETDASHYNKGVPGNGKVDVEEEDSQYEDGEVRESGDWVDDAYEVKYGNWNYQTSDYNNEAITPEMTPRPINSASKTMSIPVGGHNGTHTRKEDDIVSPILFKRSWSTNCLDGGSGASGKIQGTHSRVAGETQMHEINSGRVAVGFAATVSQSERCNDGLGDDLSSIKMKNTGWDMFPEDQRHSQRNSRDQADSSNRCVLSSIDAGGGDDSIRKMGVSNRDVQRFEQPRSFDRPHRDERSRSDDGYASGSKAERAVDSRRSSNIYDASRHIQGDSRGEQWMENSKHPRSNCHKSPEGYNYGPSGPRNAAEAAVAKMESNGFVVACDGTLVRAVDAANGGNMAGRMRNTLSSSHRPLSGRDSPVDRDGTCGLSRGPANAREASPERHFRVRSNRSGRYGPEMETDHTSNGNLSKVRYSLSSRQKDIPTGRASLSLSRAHSRSPGSRSRSPHHWASPRNRRIMENGGLTLQRPSKSPPNRMAKVRMARMTSPQRKFGYDDRDLRYSPPPRNHNYSHASAWVDGKNTSAVDFSDHTKRYSRRSPLRITSRSDRFDVMESQGRSRPGEFYRPIQGRPPYGYDRGNKHDGNDDDQREHTGRYQSRSVKPYDRNGSLKQFRNNTGDKFRTRILAPRSPELQRRASPRRFGRSFER